MSITSAAVTAPTAVPKMSLKDITTKGRIEGPMRILLYGTAGIGKSTFAAQAEEPYFISVEDGSNQLNVAGRSRPKSYPEVLAHLRLLHDEGHPYKTVVIDTVDAIEPMIWEYIVKRDNTPKKPLKTIASYGYGDGFVVAMTEWRKLVVALDVLFAKGMNIILLGHSTVRAHKPPEGEGYDKYELKLHKGAAGYLREWADMVLFTNYEIHAVKSDARAKAQGVATGARLLYTSASAVYEAKNRFALPETLNLSFDDLRMAMKGRDPKAVVSEIKRKAELIAVDEEVNCLAALDRAAGDITKLMQLNSWVNSRPQVRAIVTTEE